MKNTSDSNAQNILDGATGLETISQRVATARTPDAERGGSAGRDGMRQGACYFLRNAISSYMSLDKQCCHSHYFLGQGISVCVAAVRCAFLHYESVTAGFMWYASYCCACHAKSGPGQNPSAWTSFGSQKWSQVCACVRVRASLRVYAQ